jgi:hypothetical protein
MPNEVAYCKECGERIVELSSGVWRHEPGETGEGLDLDEDHEAAPEGSSEDE